MYNFVDTINSASGGAGLPSEALALNGAYLENQITGYRTLRVSGREALSPDVESYETGIRDGSRLKHRRYPERIITVTYQLIAASDEAFRAAYNKLAQLLDVENAQLSFADEPGKYFVGTPCTIGSVQQGTNAVTGKLEFLCTDPFKYDATEQTVAFGTDSSKTVNCSGTYRTYPTLEVDFPGECGYAAFFDERGSIIQLGDPEEVDGVADAFPKSQALFNQELKTATAWNDAGKAPWTINGASFEYQQLGTLGMKLLDGTNYYLAPTSYGTNSGWHGASISRTIPADAAGDSGSTLFDLKFKPVFAIADGGAGLESCGEFSAILLAADGTKVIKLRLCKNSPGNTASLIFYVGSNVIYRGTVDVSPGNTAFGSGLNNPNCVISKDAHVITFTMGGVKKTFAIKKSANIPAVTKVEFMFSQYGTAAPVAQNGLLWCRFVKNFCDTYYDIPNKFQPGDSVSVDCASGTILLNGVPAPELGALGNDWEQFYLRPGANQIGFAYSDWVADANRPVVRLKYRGCYI